MLPSFLTGGYSLSCSPGHWIWLSDLQKELSKSSSFSVVVPVYTLAPKGQYPLQLKQAAETLAWLLKQGKKPGDVWIPSANVKLKQIANETSDRPCRRLSRRPHGVVVDLAPSSPTFRRLKSRAERTACWSNLGLAMGEIRHRR